MRNEWPMAIVDLWSFSSTTLWTGLSRPSPPAHTTCRIGLLLNMWLRLVNEIHDSSTQMNLPTHWSGYVNDFSLSETCPSPFQRLVLPHFKDLSFPISETCPSPFQRLVFPHFKDLSFPISEACPSPFQRLVLSHFRDLSFHISETCPSPFQRLVFPHFRGYVLEAVGGVALTLLLIIWGLCWNAEFLNVVEPLVWFWGVRKWLVTTTPLHIRQFTLASVSAILVSSLDRH